MDDQSIHTAAGKRMTKIIFFSKALIVKRLKGETICSLDLILNLKLEIQIKSVISLRILEVNHTNFRNINY